MTLQVIRAYRLSVLAGTIAVLGAVAFLLHGACNKYDLGCEERLVCPVPADWDPDDDCTKEMVEACKNYHPWTPPGPDAGDGPVESPVDGADAKAKDTASDAEDAPVLLDDAGLPCGTQAWTPVPGGAGCSLYQADPAKLCLAPRTWTPCGPGCLVAPSMIAPNAVATYRLIASADYAHGAIHVRTTEGWPEPKTHFQHVTRLSDGAILAFLDQIEKGW